MTPADLDRIASLDRIIKKIAQRLVPGAGPLDCLVWTGAKSNGYGRYGRVRVHRAVYQACVGPIPPGLQIDHLCRNRACANVLHLEAVTQAENIRRGVSPTAQNRRKVTCPQGHLFDGRRQNGRRRCCRTCKQQDNARAHARIKMDPERLAHKRHRRREYYRAVRAQPERLAAERARNRARWRTRAALVKATTERR